MRRRRDDRAAVGWAWTGRNLILDLDEALAPHNSVCGPGLHNFCGTGPGLGLKSYLRAGSGPQFQASAGP